MENLMKVVASPIKLSPGELELIESIIEHVYPILPLAARSRSNPARCWRRKVPSEKGL